MRSWHPLRCLPLTSSRHVIFSDKFWFNLSADDHHACMWRQPGPWSNICCWVACSNYPRCESMRIDLLGHAITTNCLSRYYDSSQLCGHNFNDDWAVYAVKLPKCHLPTRQCSSTYCMSLTTISSKLWHTPIACQITRSLANIESLGRDGMGW